MKKLFAAMVLCSVAVQAQQAVTPQTGPTPVATTDLQKRLEGMARVHRGKVALFAKHLRSGATLEIDADRPLKTASVIKLPLMVQAFSQVSAGKARLSDKMVMKGEDRVEGSGVLNFLHGGLELTLEDGLVLMVILSDNTATNLVIDKVGLAPTNQMLADMGLKNTYFYKKVYKPAEGPMPADQKQFGLGKTTAREMAAVLEGIERCESQEAYPGKSLARFPLNDRALCKRMIEIMKNQQYRNMIPHYLETGDTSEKPSAIADKLGALDAVRIDVGIVYSGTGPIVMSLFTYENKDESWSPENEGELLIGKMAKVIVDEWAPAGVTPTPKDRAK